jgi:transposase
VKNEKTINQIASEYSVAPSCITDWKKQLLEQGPNIFKIRASIKSPEAHEDVEYLQKQIGKLTIQVDWLKKKSGITC